MITKKQVALFLKSIKRMPDSHKGDNGRVLVIAGSKEYPGAAYLAGAGVVALRTGTDLVTVASPEKVAWAINCLNPDLITTKLPGDYLKEEHFSILKELIKKNDVILIGPGISTRKETERLVLSVVRFCVKNHKQMVIDADAIKMLELRNLENCILTPHDAEFLQLTSQCDDIKKVIGNNVILLKGKTDLIISKDTTIENKTGNSGMTVAGTGDVLSGLCGGFLSQSHNLLESALAAAFIHGMIGDKLKKQYSHSFIASDFLSEIATIIRELKAKY